MRDVFFLSCGRFRVPAHAVRPPGQRAGSTSLSNTVAVGIRDDGSVVLVDAGWSTSTCAEPSRALGRLYKATLGVQVAAEDAIAVQLAALGIDRSRVKTIVATHLHLDHVGGVADFPDAEVVVAARELAAARRWPRKPGYRAEDLARLGRVRTVAWDGGPTYGFPASSDVFGDGQVVLLDAQGHTAGSVAVALRGARTYVHVGDAVYQRWEFGVSPPGPCVLARVTGWNGAEARRARAYVRACEADPRRPVVVPSHDAEVFEDLPQVPGLPKPN